MRGETNHDAGVADGFQKIANLGEFARAALALGRTTVVHNADRFLAGNFFEQRMIVFQWRVRKQYPLHRASFGAMPGQVAHGTRIVRKLPGIDATLFAMLQHLADALGSGPFGHVGGEEAIEMGVSVKGIAADDQPRHLPVADLDFRQ